MTKTPVPRPRASRSDGEATRARILAVANAYVRLGGLERLKPQAGKGLDAKLVGLLEKLPQ